MVRCSYYIWSSKRTYTVGGNDDCSKLWEKKMFELEAVNWKDPNRKVRHEHVEALFSYPTCMCACDIPSYECNGKPSPLGDVVFVKDPEEVAAELAAAEEEVRKGQFWNHM